MYVYVTFAKFIYIILKIYEFFIKKEPKLFIKCVLFISLDEEKEN